MNKLKILFTQDGIFNIFLENIKMFITTKLWNRNYPFNLSPFSLKQVHGNKIIEIKNNNFLKKEGDGLFTINKNIPLEVKVADCFPVFIFNKDIIMLLHVGWRGAKSKLVDKGIEILKERTNIRDTYVIIGPGIKKCCYEIKEDVARFFKEFVEEREYKLYFDLEKFIINRFIEKNFDFKKIISFPYCTFCRNDLFYSHRRGDKGRNRAWILKE